MPRSLTSLAKVFWGFGSVTGFIEANGISLSLLLQNSAINSFFTTPVVKGAISARITAKSTPSLSINSKIPSGVMILSKLS